MDETGPIQILELNADGSAIIRYRGTAGRGHKWKAETPTLDLDAAVARFLALAPGYVPPAVRAPKMAAWRRIFGRNHEQA